MPKATRAAKTVTLPSELERIVANPLELLLDSRNPRLYGTEAYGSSDQNKLLKTVWSFGVEELVESISTSGFHGLEPLFAEPRSDGRLVVVEGNRRLTALQLLLEPGRAKALGIPPMPALDGAIKASCEKVPVVLGQRDHVWQFIATKHVNGAQTWSSVAKAAYIKHVHEEFGKSLEEIAQAIGDRNQTTLRMYSAIKVIDQAEEWGVFDRTDQASGGELRFSHLYTLLGYPSVRRFLGQEVRPDPRTPVPNKSKKQLGELLRWIYGSRRLGIAPLVKRQNPDARHLAEALEAKEGVKALREGYEPLIALDMAKGDEQLLTKFLLESRDQLRLASARFPTGYAVEKHAAVFMDIREIVRSMIAQESAKTKSDI